MSIKYRLLHDDIKVIHDEFHPNPITLYRIIAVTDILHEGVYVKAGDLGGYVESTNNLSHEGNCWIADDACVFNNARIYDNAYVGGNCSVEDNAEVYGEAYLDGEILVLDDAKVHGNILIQGPAIISDNAEMCGKIQIETRIHIAISTDAYVTKTGDIIAAYVPSDSIFYDMTKTFFMRRDGTYGSESVGIEHCVLDKIVEDLDIIFSKE